MKVKLAVAALACTYCQQRARAGAEHSEKIAYHEQRLAALQHEVDVHTATHPIRERILVERADGINAAAAHKIADMLRSMGKQIVVFEGTSKREACEIREVVTT